MHILVIGAGSIGQRHVKNFQSLGCEVSILETNEHRRNQVMRELGVNNWEDKPLLVDGVVVATPPVNHIELANEWCGTPILMEKNLCLSYAETEQLKEQLYDERFLMGYTWRWWPTLEIARSRLDELGEIRHVTMTMAAHLADWHPWESVEVYYGSARGGVLNEAHWHDIMLSWFGEPEHAWAKASHISNLNTPTPDVLDAFFEYEGFNVNMHYDLFQRPHDRSMQIVGEQGTMQWTPNELRIGHFKDPEWRVWKTEHDRNGMFLDMAKEFLELVEGKIEAPRCGLGDGIRVMRLIETSLKGF
jgi:predicted dehydrogenase